MLDCGEIKELLKRGSGNNRNMGVLNFRDGEIGYLTRVVAALKSKTNRIGYIGGNSFKEKDNYFAPVTIDN